MATFAIPLILFQSDADIDAFINQVVLNEDPLNALAPATPSAAFQPAALTPAASAAPLQPAAPTPFFPLPSRYQ